MTVLRVCDKLRLSMYRMLSVCDRGLKTVECLCTEFD